MAMEAKPFASLSSGLLARKGAARPAMRPQGFGQVGGSLEDLGWNDMGFEPPKPAALERTETRDAFSEGVVEHPRAHPTGLTPVQSPVHDQQAEIVERLNGFDDMGEDEVDDTAEAFKVTAVEPVAVKTAAKQPVIVVEPEVTAEEPVAIKPVVKQPVIVAELEATAEEPAAIQAAVKQPVIVAASEAKVEEPAKIQAAKKQPIVVPAQAVRRTSRVRVAPGTKGRAAFTLRLDPDRHLKLRLACAVDGRSAQQLVTDALDQLLERMPEVDGLAVKAKRRG